MSSAAIATAYDPALAAELVTLATLANQPLADLYLPGDWGLIYSFKAAGMYGSCQYYLAAKPSSSPTVCALVVGALWGDFISFYTPDDNHVLTEISNDIVSSNQAVMADTGFDLMYRAIRRKLWEDIARIKQTIPAFATDLPLIVVGLGPGAPVAQLASLDLRPGKTVSPSAVSSVQAYLFSCPPAVDPAFANVYKDAVPAAYRVQAPADLFPSQPVPASGYVQAGVQKSLALKIPTYDSPWVERDGPYYAQLLSGVTLAGGNRGSTGNVSGFEPTKAFALAQLSAVAYQMYQQPDSTIPFPYAPYALKQNVAINGSIWASVFEGPDLLAVAFRGTVSWLELIQLVSNAWPSTPAWLAEGYGQFAKPMVDLYASGRDSLRDALNKLGNKPALLTGHDCGGGLANLMAVDMAQNPLSGNRTVASVYTFGALPAATPPFAKNYAAGPLGGKNFQVARPRDVMPKMALLGLFDPLGTSVPLSGGDFDAYNGSTSHGLLTYLNLLNPGN